MLLYILDESLLYICHVLFVVALEESNCKTPDTSVRIFIAPANMQIVKDYLYTMNRVFSCLGSENKRSNPRARLRLTSCSLHR